MRIEEILGSLDYAKMRFVSISPCLRLLPRPSLSLLEKRGFIVRLFIGRYLRFKKRIDFYRYKGKAKAIHSRIAYAGRKVISKVRAIIFGALTRIRDVIYESRRSPSDEILRRTRRIRRVLMIFGYVKEGRGILSIQLTTSYRGWRKVSPQKLSRTT